MKNEQQFYLLMVVDGLMMDKAFPFLDQFTDPYEHKKRESGIMAEDFFPN